MADSGIAELDSMIERLRTLAGPDVARRVASKAAPGVDKALKTTANAGKTSEGKAWAPKKDGGRPLVHAADAIATKSAGNMVIATLSGPTVFHHYGAGGKPQRPVLPDNGTVPPGVRKAVLEAASAVFREVTGGRG